MTMTPVLLADWLADAGLRNLPLEQMVDGFSRRLNEMGVAVARTFVGTNTLHPMVRARSMIWDRLTGPGTHFEFNHAEIDAPAVQQSPFARMIRHGIAEQRYDLSTPAPECEIPVFEELRGAGMTEWLGRVFPFGELSPQIGGPAEAERADQLWLVCSVTTDRPGGYSESDLTVLRQLLPVFAVAAKATTMRAIGQGLLASYLGSDPATRVLAGTVHRGEVQSMSAVLFYADLRGFTGFADTLPGREVIGLLDDCFDCMVRPVASRGGEILKFLGDGLLATFRSDDKSPITVTAAALDAASEALALMETLAAKREGAGKPTPGLDIALHVGNVLYGNVGTDARLDFTVIGPAVNEAARIEFLCKSLGHNLLVSQAFAAAVGADGRRLVSVGRHALRGVREETELFTLAPEPAP
jgi:adenylate cyclase